MNDDDLRELILCAMNAHKEERYDEELQLWERLCAERPDQLEFLHNVALAKSNAGHLEEALEMFDDLAIRAPKLSRVHNNRASVLVRLGADIQHLIPSFLAAVYLSETSDDFMRHVINVCQSAAFGPDDGGEELLHSLEEPILVLVRERFAPEYVDRTVAELQYVFVAYRHLARYRRTLGRKEWIAADEAITSAQDSFHALGLQNLVRGTEGLRRHLLICRDVFGLLEDVGSDQALGSRDALERVRGLLGRAASMRENEGAGVLRRLLDVLGWFLNAFMRQLAFLSGTAGAYERSSDAAKIMTWLSSSSFRSIGDDLLTVINFSDRQCVDLCDRLRGVASPAVAEHARRDEWTRIALCVHGRVFDFRGVDVALAHAMMGWRDDALGRIRAELADLRDFVERQAYADIIVDGKARENIARALIQARLSARSYREVPVRGGRSDVLAFIGNKNRILIEAKLWKGPEYHEQGVRELAEYIAGENDDRGLLGAFYVVFDPTEGAKAIAHEGSPVTARTVAGTSIDVLIIRLRPPTPSKTVANGAEVA